VPATAADAALISAESAAVGAGTGAAWPARRGISGGTAKVAASDAARPTAGTESRPGTEVTASSAGNSSENGSEIDAFLGSSTGWRPPLKCWSPSFFSSWKLLLFTVLPLRLTVTGSCAPSGVDGVEEISTRSSREGPSTAFDLLSVVSELLGDLDPPRRGDDGDLEAPRPGDDCDLDLGGRPRFLGGSTVGDLGGRPRLFPDDNAVESGGGLLRGRPLGLPIAPEAEPRLLLATELLASLSFLGAGARAEARRGVEASSPSFSVALTGTRSRELALPALFALASAQLGQNHFSSAGTRSRGGSRQYVWYSSWHMSQIRSLFLDFLPKHTRHAQKQHT
jgi:hypothetical protein